jgi:DNA replication protein DnaC
VCPDCGGAGWLSAGPALGRDASAALIKCHCLADRQREAAQHQQSARARTLLDALAAELGRYRGVTFATFDPQRRVSADTQWGGRTYTPQDQRAMLTYARDQARAYADVPRGWLLFAGPVGSGKTHLAAATANALAADGYAVSYASTPALLRFVRQGFEDHSADARLEALMHCDVLVLDDLGSEQLTGWSEALLFDLVNARYNAERATLYTTNLALTQLTGRIGSRISELAAVVPVIATDYRMEQRGAACD